jgi:hypothetical protein
MKNTRFGFVVAMAFSLIAGILIGCAPTVRADQPHMEAALDSLQNAEHELSVAEEDKGGHRANAMRLTRDAIAETRRGIEFARHH